MMINEILWFLFQYVTFNIDKSDILMMYVISYGLIAKK